MDRNRRRVRLGALSLLVAMAMATGLASIATAKESEPNGVVNLNTATIEQLQLLPGVGESRAAAIVAMRSERGGFKKVDEITAVKGIGPSVLDRMRPHLAVEGKTTITR